MTAIELVAHLNAGLAGRYEIERELGAGGMAPVYRARDSRPVALRFCLQDGGLFHKFAQ